MDHRSHGFFTSNTYIYHHIFHNKFFLRIFLIIFQYNIVDFFFFNLDFRISLSANENIDIGIRLFVPTYMRTHTYPSSDKSPVKKRNGVNKRTTQTNVQAYTQAYLSVCLVRSEQRPNPIRPNPKPWKEIQ